MDGYGRVSVCAGVYCVGDALQLADCSPDGCDENPGRLREIRMEKDIEASIAPQLFSLGFRCNKICSENVA